MSVKTRLGAVPSQEALLSPQVKTAANPSALTTLGSKTNIQFDPAMSKPATSGSISALLNETFKKTAETSTLRPTVSPTPQVFREAGVRNQIMNPGMLAETPVRAQASQPPPAATISPGAAPLTQEQTQQRNIQNPNNFLGGGNTPVRAEAAPPPAQITPRLSSSGMSQAQIDQMSRDAIMGNLGVPSAMNPALAQIGGPVLGSTFASGADSYQSALLAELEKASKGLGGSIAQDQLAAGSNRAAGQAFGAAQGAREIGFGARTRSGADAMAGITGDAAAQQNILQLSEMQSAREQLAAALQAKQTQDLDFAQQQTQFGQEIGQGDDVMANQQLSDMIKEGAFKQDILEQLKNAEITKDWTDYIRNSKATDAAIGGAGALAGTVASMASSGKKDTTKKQEEEEVPGLKNNPY